MCHTSSMRKPAAMKTLKVSSIFILQNVDALRQDMPFFLNFIVSGASVALNKKRINCNKSDCNTLILGLVYQLPPSNVGKGAFC